MKICISKKFLAAGGGGGAGGAAGPGNTLREPVLCISISQPQLDIRNHLGKLLKFAEETRIFGCGT